jgi:cell division septation protein DedD
MLSNHPTPEREEPASSPALARRRDHMLRSDPTRQIEPRLVPAADRDQPSLLPQAAFDLVDEPEPDPDIPPPPPTALRARPEAAAKRTSRSLRRGRLWAVGAAGAAVVAAGGIAWLIYERTQGVLPGGEVPYIAADAGPEKIRPQQAGGIDVPNQDIRVYNELNGSKPAKEGEVLLPPAEAPVTPPTAPDTKSQTATAEVPSVPAAPTDVAPAAGTSVQPDASAGPDDKHTAPATVDQPTQIATTTGAFRIQLAAVKTHDAAQAAWKKLTKSYPDVLKGLALNIVKADRSGGAVFRVQGGPFASRDAAESACSKLKQKSQACLVVSP